MNRIFSTLKVLCCVFLFFVFSLFAFQTSARAAVQAPCTTASCLCPTGSTNCQIHKYRCNALTNGANCSDILVQTVTSPNVAVTPEYASQCGTTQVDMSYKGSDGVVKAGFTSIQYPVQCNSSGNLVTCPATMPNNGTCPTGQCQTGRVYCSQNGTPSSYALCKQGNLGCSLNGCTGQMSYCNANTSPASFACKADASCTSVTPPPPSNWECGKCQVGTNCNNNPPGSGDHPMSECMWTGSSCTWNPTACRPGSNPTPTPQPRACGEACNTTADCRNPSTGGFPVECRNKKCQLPLTGTYACPEGMSSGSICGCSAKQQCGQQCGPAVGNKLCNPGTVCGFVTASSACMVNGVQQTSKQYCLPVNPAGGYSLRRCDTTPTLNYIAADSLVKPDGTQTNMTVTDVLNACKPVCGDKVVSPPEECDWGTDNGKPGSMCDATCKTRKVCGDACTATSACNKHLVTLTCVPGTGRPYCGFDALVENDVTLQENNARFTKPGIWRVSTGTTFSGGTEVYNHEVGSTISFWTTARSVKLVQTKAANRGMFTVSIDGKVQPNKIDQYNATTSYQQTTEIVLRGTDFPEHVCQSNQCRLASNPTSSTCVGGVPTPTPPSGPLVCDLTVSWASNANPDAWKFGDMITFTVAPAPSSRIPSGGSIRYDGQVAVYRGTEKTQDITLTPINAGASKFNPMKVERANATYYFRFRYCVKTSAGVETCSSWGNWAVPTAAGGSSNQYQASVAN